jgi:hypothetical protein
LNIIDDHSRLCLGSDARRTTTGAEVVASFREAFARWASRPARSGKPLPGGHPGRRDGHNIACSASVYHFKQVDIAVGQVTARDERSTAHPLI